MCAHLTITVSEIERDIGRKSSFFHTPCIDALVRGVPVGISPLRSVRYEKKTRMVWLDDGEKFLKISLFVLTQLTNVTDTQTHTHRQSDTACQHIPHRAVKTETRSSQLHIVNTVGLRPFTANQTRD